MEAYSRSISVFFYKHMFEILVFVALINVVTCLLFRIDKNRAKKRKTRIPEATLISLTIAGGCIGAMIGMCVFRHKTKHAIFIFVTLLSFFVYSALFLAAALGML